MNGVNDYEKESIRRAALRDEILKKQVKKSGFMKESRKRAAALKLLSRWQKGTTVRDKRTGYEFIYRGNVNDPDGVRYLMEVACQFGNPRIKHSMIPHKDIVRV